jgi:hypothetical protein
VGRNAVLLRTNTAISVRLRTTIFIFIRKRDPTRPKVGKKLTTLRTRGGLRLIIVGGSTDWHAALCPSGMSIFLRFNTAVRFIFISILGWTRTVHLTVWFLMNKMVIVMKLGNIVRFRSIFELVWGGDGVIRWRNAIRFMSSALQFRRNRGPILVNIGFIFRDAVTTHESRLRRTRFLDRVRHIACYFLASVIFVSSNFR